MAADLGPYTQLLIRRTSSDRAITVKVLQATAERLGWLAAFPTVWDPSAAPATPIRYRAWGGNLFAPYEGGAPSGAWLVVPPRRDRTFPRLRFRVTGPWTRADLTTLRDATVPELHALTAGRLRWSRLSP